MECHTAVRHFYLEAEVQVVLIDFVVFAAASEVAFFSFAVAAVAVAAVAAAVAAAAVVSFAAAVKVHAVAFAGSPLLLVVVVVDWKAVVHLFEEFDLLAGVQRRFLQQLRLTDLTFVVLRRTMLRYYSFQFK